MHQSDLLDENIKNILVKIASNHLADESSIRNISVVDGIFGKSEFVVLTSNNVFHIDNKLSLNPKLSVQTYDIETCSKNRSGMLEISYEIRKPGKKVDARKVVFNVNKLDIDILLKDINEVINEQRMIKERQLEEDLVEANERLKMRGEYIGVLAAESGMQTFARRANNASDRRFSDLMDSGGSSIEVWENMIIQSGTEYLIDGYVSAQVQVNGQVQVTHRPTLTRMGLLAPIPGSALIPGLALSKKAVHDSREVLVTISHPKWSISVRVSYSNLSNVQTIANRVNKISEFKYEKQDYVNSTSDKVSNKLDKIYKLAELFEKGNISELEYDKLKREILSEES